VTSFPRRQNDDITDFIILTPCLSGKFCSVLFCSFAVLDPRVGHTMDVLSPFISVLWHSDWLFQGSPVHVLMLSIQAVRGLPRLRAPGIVPCIISRDQPNSRFHGRDIFSKIGLLPWKRLISVKSVIFLWILTLLLSEGFRVLSAAFVWILLFAMCHTWALDCLESWLSIYICSKYSLFRNFKNTIRQIS